MWSSWGWVAMTRLKSRSFSGSSGDVARWSRNGRQLRRPGDVDDDRAATPRRVLRQQEQLGVAIAHVEQEVEEIRGRARRLEAALGAESGFGHRGGRGHRSRSSASVAISYTSSTLIVGARAPN